MCHGLIVLVKHSAVLWRNGGILGVALFLFFFVPFYSWFYKNRVDLLFPTFSLRYSHSFQDRPESPIFPGRRFYGVIILTFSAWGSCSEWRRWERPLTRPSSQDVEVEMCALGSTYCLYCVGFGAILWSGHHGLISLLLQNTPSTHFQQQNNNTI